MLNEPEPPLSISHFTHAMRGYRTVILLSLAGVALAYLILAIALYLVSPAQQITTQNFRLDFEGAGKGEYPNKTKFNIADIVSGPILTRVWRDNRLGDYISFGDFSHSVFVLEANRQYELLAAEYQARLADPKISPIDRERLQKEFDQKADSISKNEYALSIERRAGLHSIPDPVARKVLLDILNTWADFAVNQQHIIAYQISVLSPEILKPSAVEQRDVVMAIEVLRAKANRVMSNILNIENLPGAMQVRTADHMSLEETRIRLDDIVRFRLEPLLASTLRSPGLTGDRATTVRFLESQLAYDQRQLESSQRLADSIRDSIAVYEQPAETASTAPVPSRSGDSQKAGEALMPQLSDTFLDRLVAMTGRSADAQYRQNMVDEYRKAVGNTIPLKQAVAYDTAVLEELKKPTGGTSTMTAASVRAEIDQARTDVGQLVNTMNDLFQIVSRNMTPSTQLFTFTTPPTTRMLRSVTVSRLALYGVLTLLLALPAIIVLCLLHNRVREEEAAADYMRHERKLATAEPLP